MSPLQQEKEREKAIQVGINGFGRIGRIALRSMIERGSHSYHICGINLRNADLDFMVYQVKYDSVFRTFYGTVEHDGQNLIVNGQKIRVYSYSDAAEIPWDDCYAEYIIESTGAYLTKEKASVHLKNGAKKVILSAPSKDTVTPTFVMGVNHETYKPDMDVVSNASCTTNCLAPMTKVINDTFGIEQALMSTIHSATAKQKPVDSRGGKDWRTGRSVLGNIIPSTTGAAKAVGEVIPELKGRMTGMSFRVPTADVSVVDLTGFPQTCIFDETAGIMLDDNFVKCIAWYDNEWGYTNKLIDLLTYMHSVDHPVGVFSDER